MAVRAGDLPLKNRVVRLLIDLSTLFFVARKADLSLSSFVTYLVLLGMNLMAAIAGDVATIMSAARPKMTLRILLMASQAGFASQIRWRRRILAETLVNLRRLVATLVLHVLFALAVAINASRCALVGGGAMFGLADRKHLRIQFEHRGHAGGFVGLVMATGAFRIALEDQILGIRVACKLLGRPGRGLRRIGRSKHRCGRGQGADNGTKSQ